MTFNFNIDGKSGFDPMVRVGGGSCPAFNGQALDASGHWYSPSLAGFGYTYLATGGANPQEVLIPYVYDAQGFPRVAKIEVGPTDLIEHGRARV